MAVNNASVEQKETIFQVDGITCMDCAQKFEKAISEMPGVITASLNLLTGKLVVEGQSDIEGIRRLGADEGYTINPEPGQPAQPLQKQGRQPDWELRRVILSGLSLVIGYGVEKLVGGEIAFLPLYIAAMALGGWGNFRKAARALPRANFNMSVLMSVAVIGAFAIGQYEEGASVAFLYAISEMLESWTMEKARRSLGILNGCKAKAKQ